MNQLRAGFGLGGRIDRALSEKVDPSFPFGTDEYWMEQALLCAMNSVGLSPPNPSVGCVLVKNDEVLATGFTQVTGREHAERMAFLSLPEHSDLSGVTAYVTLEPCSHFGSQPPCADLFLNSGIKRVVVACQDPDPRVNGEGISRLRANGIEVKIGVLEKEAQAFLFPFFFQRKMNRPAWIAKWAQTPKGYLADATGVSKWITNPKSRAYTHWLRQKYDAIVIGAETYLKDHPSLTVRDSAMPHNRSPVPILFDPKGRCLEFNVPSHFLHFVGKTALNSRLASENTYLFPEGSGEDSIFENFKNVVDQHPFQKPLQSVMVEGGPTLINGFLKANLFNAAHQFTGVKEFSTEDDRYRTTWNPSGFWNYATSYYFDQDHLQEWWKGF